MHKKNIATFPPWPVAKSVARIWDPSETVDLAYYLTPDSDLDNIKWIVEETAQVSSEYMYGGLPDLNEIINVRVEAIHLSDNTISDRMILVIVPQSTKDRFRDWVSNNLDISWINELPAVYSTLGTNSFDPEPSITECDQQSWESVDYLDKEYHPFASFEMRSERINGHGHQTCYNTHGDLIVNGLSAGTADFGHHSIPFGAFGHITQDVLPFIWAAQLDGNPVQGTPGSTIAPDNLSHPIIHQGHPGSKLDTYLVFRPIYADNTVKEGNCVPNLND